MRYRRDRGFTLIEVMIVLVIIGICAAIVVPQLIAHKKSSSLTELVSVVQQTAAQARSLALQTRRAAVLEVSGSQRKIWINTLQGPKCWDALSQTCVQTYGHATDAPELALTGEPYDSAGVGMCDVQVYAIASAEDGTPSCEAVGDLGPDSDFALCYTGDGELFVRAAADEGTACADGAAASVGRDAWLRSCALLGTDADVTGATLRFNRFEGGAGVCTGDDGGTGDAVDVTRAVYLPMGGAPYSRVEL